MIGERKPPSSGAIAGASPWIAISAEKAEAAALPCATSGMTERATTTVVPPAMPWSRRKAISKPIDGVSAHPAEKRKNSNEPITRGRRRPTPSEIGPANNWPTARPIMKAESVSCTDEAVVDRSFAMSMNVGRYMSVPSGPAADSRASDVRTAAVSWFFFGTLGDVPVDFGSAEWTSTRSTLPTDDERPRSGDEDGEGFEDDEFGSVLTRCTYRVTFLCDNNALHRITCWLRTCDVSTNGRGWAMNGFRRRVDLPKVHAVLVCATP